AQPLLLGLGLGRAELAAILALPSAFGSAEAVAKAASRWRSASWGGALTHRVDPGHVGLLEPVQFLVPVAGGGTGASAAGGGGFLSAVHAPVRGLACRARGLLAGGDLGVNQVKLHFVGTLESPHGSAARATRATRHVTPA